MRWPIRNQLVVPFALVLLVAVATTAITSAYLAAKRSEEHVIRQLRTVTETLAQSNFPLTRSVLEKVRGLSGAHFVVRDARGSIVETSLPGTNKLPDSLKVASKASHQPTFTEYRNLTLDGVRYIAAEVRIRGRQRGAALLVLYPEETLRQARWDAALPPLVIGAVAMGAMVVVAFWLAHRFSSRIRSVQKQVGAIASGEFREIGIGSGDDEIRELVASVNQMCTQLRLMQETIRRSERTNLLGQVAGGLAHQLRNAITGARMALQIHQKRCTADATDESLDVALRQLALTEEQIRGLLSLGQQQSRNIPFEVEPVVDEVARLVRPACEHAHVAFRHECKLAGCRAVGDPDDLRAAVLNLAFNAVEAAGPSGEVSLSAVSRSSTVEIEVIDDGAGPPPDLRDSLFEPFVTSKPEGVGLGLAVASQVASEHGGRLTWERRDQRTRFRLSIPLARRSASEDAPQRSTAVVGQGVPSPVAGKNR